MKDCSHWPRNGGPSSGEPGRDRYHRREVTVLCEEPRPAYDRVHLSEFFSGKSAAELSLVEPGFFERTGFRRGWPRALPALTGAPIPSPRRMAKSCRTTSSCWPQAPTPSCPRCRGATARTALCTRTIEDLEAMQAAGSQGPLGRGDWRRPAGAGMRQGPCATWAWKPMWWSSPPSDGSAGGRRPGAVGPDRAPGRAGAHGPQHAADHRWRAPATA